MIARDLQQNAGVRLDCGRAPRRVRRVQASAHHAVVVGGGIGGLTTACKLAKAGVKVTLLEQNEEVGGRCQSQHVHTERGVFRFDTGPSLLLFPQVYEETFASLGTCLEARVQVERVQPAAYRVWFQPTESSSSSSGNHSDQAQTPAPARKGALGGYLDLLYDLPLMLKQMERVEDGAGRAYVSWLAQARAALEVGVEEFIKRDFDNIFDFLDLRRLLPLLGQVDIAELLGQHNKRLRKRFKDPRIQALLSFQDLYVGLSPYSAPGVFSLLCATELTDGVCYPIGGFQTIKQALADVAVELGVNIRTSCKVVRVTTTAAQGKGRQRVTGVVLESGEELAADVCVSNSDVPLSYELLKEDVPSAAQQQQRIASLDFSASVLEYNLCLDTQLPSSLLHHNVFVSNKGEQSWERAGSADTLLPRPNFYCHRPACTDRSAAPSGCDSLMILLPVANLQQAPLADQAQLLDAGRDAIARTFKEEGLCSDLFSHVLHEFTIGPEEWKRRYSIEHGAVFGLSHSLQQLALFRPGAKTGVDGFYLVGASSRPGNGVPLVMIGADQCAARVLQDIGGHCP